MSTKKFGCLRNFLAVAFTTVVTPVLANVIAQDVKDWQDSLQRVLESKPAGRIDWSRPIVEDAGRATRAAVAEGQAPRPTQSRPEPKAGPWHWAAGAWGQ